MPILNIIAGAATVIPNHSATASTIETTKTDIHENLTDDIYHPFSKENISKHTKNLNDPIDNIEIPMNKTRKALLKVKDIDGLNVFLQNLSKQEYNNLLNNYTESQGDYAFSLKNREKLIEERQKIKKEVEKRQNDYNNIYTKSKMNKNNKHLEKKLSTKKNKLEKIKESYKTNKKRLTKINLHLKYIQENGDISYASYIKKILFGPGKNAHRRHANNMIRYVSADRILYITSHGVSERSIRQNY